MRIDGSENGNFLSNFKDKGFIKFDTVRGTPDRSVSSGIKTATPSPSDNSLLRRLMSVEEAICDIKSMLTAISTKKKGMLTEVTEGLLHNHASTAAKIVRKELTTREPTAQERSKGATTAPPSESSKKVGAKKFTNKRRRYVSNSSESDDETFQPSAKNKKEPSVAESRSDDSFDFTAPPLKKKLGNLESTDDDESYTISDFTETRAAVKAAIDDSAEFSDDSATVFEAPAVDLTQCCPAVDKVGECNVCGTRVCGVHAETCVKKKLCGGKHYCYYHKKHNSEHEGV